jgi:hypothetical protein
MAHYDVVVSHRRILELDTPDSINIPDQRQLSFKHGARGLLALTSLSWLLPMELPAVVLTPGVAGGGDHCIVATDLTCRVRHMPKGLFA